MRLGDWTIVIQGTGPHHNENNPGDADKMLDLFLLKLKLKGHNLSHAAITTGGKEEYKNLPELS